MKSQVNKTLNHGMYVDNVDTRKMYFRLSLATSPKPLSS